MRNPLIAEIRRIRAKQALERARNPHRDEVAESYELLHKVCDVVVSENGERHYVASATKMYDVLIAPRLAKEKPSRRATHDVVPLVSSADSRTSRSKI